MSLAARIHTDERGSSLVFVMVFVMAFAVVITALLGFTSTALNANKRTTDVARQQEAADAGAEFGLQAVRGGAAAVFSSPGPTTLPMPGTVNGETVATQIEQRNVTVLCVAGPANVAVGAAASYTAGLAAACSGTPATVPYGAVWSFTSVPAGASAAIAPTGVFTPAAAATYTITARVGNVSATKVVTVP